MAEDNPVMVSNWLACFGNPHVTVRSGGTWSSVSTSQEEWLNGVHEFNCGEGG